MLMGEEDESVGAANIARPGRAGGPSAGDDAEGLPGVGHNFLPLLDSDDPQLQALARDALERIERAAA
jgi:carboxymethylenebutenolidase